MKRRFSKLQALKLTNKAIVKVVVLYKEIAKCYVHGFFIASMALCRAMAESAAQEYA